MFMTIIRPRHDPEYNHHQMNMEEDERSQYMRRVFSINISKDYSNINGQMTPSERPFLRER